ncbi:rhamnulokinase [Sediminihabitans luteus]|uniref:Rhamnulokinase n=1 Tax=Sediminihabitans luteus TaxID=1138585 RepID=A0A2M9D088_9CELL|nr:rhamnulokinase family protein [Sediminihabitans luteus]PJJ77418.1 rhamnulokinase [Sediminihabitans luteus]GII98311.1 carbohydrate kinase [Sediminihabitans luteus]
MSGSPAFVAVDLGATSGRVVLGVVEGDAGAERVALTEVARFANGPVEVPQVGPDGGGAALCWDLLHLWRGTLDGLRAAALLAREQGHEVRGVGIDSWAVDHALVAADGALLGNPRHHRDPRLAGVAEEVLGRLGAAGHYAVNGLQRLPFTTEFQLVAGRHDAAWPLAASVRLVPDLLASWLTGEVVAEVTNASTTGLVDASTREWSTPVIDALEAAYPELATLRSRLGDLVEPGTVVGPLTARVQEATGLGAVPVIAVGSHDTASAVVGVPADDARFAYVSSGTWSLVGVELDAPVLTEESRAANVTNELGVDGTVRYLKNVMGLWVLSETLRTWREQGTEVTLADALAAAKDAEPRRTVVDVDAPEFLPPGDMPTRLADAARASGQPVPATVGEVVRCVLDSLADAYRRALDEIVRLSGREVDVLHVVGGGSQNELLCRLTAEATGLPVVAGPVEGAALGNLVVQARAVGALEGDLAALRTVVRRSSSLRRYEPAAATR